jgi:hypothetical protein
MIISVDPNQVLQNLFARKTVDMMHMLGQK